MKIWPERDSRWNVRVSILPPIAIWHFEHNKRSKIIKTTTEIKISRTNFISTSLINMFTWVYVFCTENSKSWQNKWKGICIIPNIHSHIIMYSDESCISFVQIEFLWLKPYTHLIWLITLQFFFPASKISSLFMANIYL